MNLSIKNVSKKIKDKTIIDNVSMELNSGCVYGLCGYNGCGKTMLMRLMVGLISPSEGRIMIDNIEIGKDRDFAPSVGMLIENPVCVEDKSAFENLKLLSMFSNSVSDNEIGDVLERVGLGDVVLSARKFSLGMKQRLGIAMAIFESPQLLILDEPTNSLDEEGVKMARNIIIEEKERGALIVLACHDKEFLEDVCDVIHYIEHGAVKRTEAKE